MHSDPSPATARVRDPRIHHDPLSGRSVFVAPERADRPIEASMVAAGAPPAEACPFCAGNERLTPPDLLRAVDQAGGWRARVIPNRYPVVRDRTESPRVETSGDAGFARGVHDVIIESPRHDTSILAIADDDWREVWRLCRERLAVLAGRCDLSWATVFKNSGPGAGASLEHVHSQLVALDFVPATIRAELAHAEARADAFDSLIREAEAAGRAVATDGDLVALAPPAPRQPFETWIVPRREGPTFLSASDEEVASLAALTRSLVARLQRVVPGADYNWWLHQGPFGNASQAASRGGYRWHLEIMPRVAALAGFELGTGCHITTLAPEESARLLREA